MIIGTIQDYISAKQRVRESFMQKCWRNVLKFFDLENDSKRWQVFYLYIMGCALWATFSFIHLIHVYKTLGGQ